MFDFNKIKNFNLLMITRHIIKREIFSVSISAMAIYLHIHLLGGKISISIGGQNQNDSNFKGANCNFNQKKIFNIFSLHIHLGCSCF